MTASTIADRHLAASTSTRFAGLGAIVRKDITEWRRGHRAWIVLAVTSLFMGLTAANAWIVTRIAEGLPPNVEAPDLPSSMAPLDNLLTAVATQIFAVASLILRERESGTLSWVASKPVSRASIWTAKFISASAMLVLAAVVAPLAATLAIVVVLYGVPDLAPVALMGVGASAAVVFYAALGLAAGTVMPGQPAIVAVGFAVYALVPALSGLVPVDVEPLLPTSILGWTVGLAAGQDVGLTTPVAWIVGTALLAGLGIRQLRRLEL